MMQSGLWKIIVVIQRYVQAHHIDNDTANLGLGVLLIVIHRFNFFYPAIKPLIHYHVPS